MSRTRAVPAEDEAPTLAEALETVAPLLEELKALEYLRAFLSRAVWMQAALPRLQDEHETLVANVSRLRAIRSDLRDEIGAGVRALKELEKAGAKITVPATVLEWGRTT